MDCCVTGRYQKVIEWNNSANNFQDFSVDMIIYCGINKIRGGSIFVLFVGSTHLRINTLGNNNLWKRYVFLLKQETDASTKLHLHE